MTEFHRFLALLLLTFAAAMPATAKADTLDTILNILYNAGVVDGAVVEAKPLIQCLVNGNSVATCSQQMAQQQAGAISASDPKIKLVVDIVLSANGGNWPKVVELTGVDLLVQIACSAGMPGGGPVKDFICGSVFSQVAQLGKPIVREVLVAVGNGDWWRLVTLVGPDLACNVIPSSVPLKDQVCGPLGKVLTTVANIASDAAEGAAQLANDVYEMFDGQSPHMSYDDYYKIYLRSSLHTRVVERLAINRIGLGLNSDQWNVCVDYFDSHEQAHDTARKTCKDLGNRLHNEAMLLVNAIEPAPQTYFDTYFKNADIVREIAANHYRTNIINDHKQFLNTVAMTDQSYSSIAKSPLAAAIKPLYLECKDYMLSRFPITPQGVMRMDIPPNVWDWACWDAAGFKLANAIQLERLRLAVNVIPALESSGCEEQGQSGSNKLSLACSNYPALNQCVEAFIGYSDQYCHLEPMTADKALAKDIINAVSPKRCHFRKTGKGGAYDPAVICTRPWLLQRCEDAMQQARNENTYLRTSLACIFYDSPEFKAARAETIDIKNALNADLPDADETATDENASAAENDTSGKISVVGKISKVDVAKKMQLAKPEASIGFANCTITPADPLAIECNDAAVVWQLPQRLPGAKLPVCQPDPNHDGQDMPCYSGLLPLPSQPKDQITIPANSLNQGGTTTIPLPGHSSSDTSKSNGKTSALPIRGVSKPRTSTMKPGKADLAAAANVRINKRSTRWNSRVTLNDTALVSQAGLCSVPLQYTLMNIGKAPSNMAKGSWTGKGINVQHGLAALAAGAKKAMTTNLKLAPGTYRLQLVLDSTAAIDEENEKNNRYGLTVTITGQCGAMKKTSPTKSLPMPSPLPPKTKLQH